MRLHEWGTRQFSYLWHNVGVTNRAPDRTGFIVTGGPNECGDQAVTERIFTDGEGETAEVI